MPKAPTHSWTKGNRSYDGTNESWLTHGPVHDGITDALNSRTSTVAIYASLVLAVLWAANLMISKPSEVTSWKSSAISSSAMPENFELSKELLYKYTSDSKLQTAIIAEIAQIFHAQELDWPNAWISENQKISFNNAYYLLLVTNALQNAGYIKHDHIIERLKSDMNIVCPPGTNLRFTPHILSSTQPAGVFYPSNDTWDVGTLVTVVVDRKPETDLSFSHTLPQ